MFKLFLNFLILSLLPLSAATVSFTSNCDSHLMSSHTTTSSCVAGPTDTQLYTRNNLTQVNSAYDLVVGPTITLSVSQTATAISDGNIPPERTLSYSTSSQGTINYSETLSTSGPVRAGFVHIGGGNHDNGAADGSSGLVEFNINNVTGSSDPSLACIAVFNFQNPCSPAPGYFNNYLPFFPVTLGTNFFLTAQGRIYASGDSLNYGGYGAAQYFAHYDLQFFEADKTTVVTPNVVDTPEPTSLALMSLPLTALFLLSRRK